MKLNDKTNRYFLSASLIVFCLGGILFYFLFQGIIDQDFNKRLHQRKEYYIDVLVKSDSILRYQQYSANSIFIAPTKAQANSNEVISDTVLFDQIENKYNTYRQVSLVMALHGQNYKIQVRRALVERKDIIQGVVILEILLFIAFVVILSILNNQLSKKLWRPFYSVLDKINNYKADKAEMLNFDKSSITEFNELSSVIESMTLKINQEFHILKEFTENASHEIQTPLAIVKNKLEILLQSPGLKEDQMELINAASIAATRLSKLNEALLILSRIENRQFHVVDGCSANDLFDKHLNYLEELMQVKNINVKKRYESELHFMMNGFLADILIENLLVNGIKHNFPGGTITVLITSTSFSIMNTGENPRRETNDLFQRFVKSNSKSQSLGLGLSIVKAICDTYGYGVSYLFEDNLHKITVTLTSKELL